MSHSPVRRSSESEESLALEGFLQGLARRGKARGQVVHVQDIPPREARYATLSPPFPDPLRTALRQAGIDRLFACAVAIAR